MEFAMRIIFFLTALMFAFSAPLSKEPQGIIPNFRVLAIDNETELSQDDLKANAKKNGAKRIALSFFATWCKNCAEEFVHLKNNAGELRKNGVQVYLIDVGESIHKDGDKVSDMVKKYAGDFFPLYFDPNGNLLRKLGFVEENGRYPLPLVVVLDSDLHILGTLMGVSKDSFPQVLWGEF